MKNYFRFSGTVCKNAERYSVYGYEEKDPLVSFVVKDFMNECGEPLKLQVHYMDFENTGIEKRLVRGQEVVVEGRLQQKSYITSGGEFRVKLYVKATSVHFVKSKEGEAA